MQVRHDSKTGEVAVKLLRRELAVLWEADQITQAIRRNVGEEAAGKLIAESVAAFRERELEKAHDEAVKAGAEEDARPILQQAGTAEAKPGKGASK